MSFFLPIQAIFEGGRLTTNSILRESFVELKTLDTLEITWKPEWGPVLAQVKSIKTFVNAGIGKLDGLVETLMQLPQLHRLIFRYNWYIQELPEDLDRLSPLEVLEITNNHNLSSLPENLGELPNLKRLVIRDCPNLYDLPASLAKLTTLKELEVVDTGVSKEEIERLRAQLPECEIVYED
jgi:Leucine-rich repeat (LRR) protein